MKQISLLISRYLIQAIVPYFVFSWLLLSVILFVQQAGRFSDIFFSVNLPASLVWQLMIALIPNVIAFTAPMAMLVGTIIGLSKMQGDSELVAIRAAGVGNLQIAVPIVLLGILLSLFAFFVNLKGVPVAAALVRSIALQTAVKKLESPIEPGVFNTEIAGYTIYVKGGDFETGRWKNIFIYQQDAATGDTRLITSSEGRIDVTNQYSELVLENATVSTLPKDLEKGKYASENIGEVRIAIKTRRDELIERLSIKSGAPEELGLTELSNYAKNTEGKDRIEAELLWQRRIILSISPLIFCMLGTAMVLRFNRSGRGFGIVLSLVGLVGYYLLTFLGEQIARTGQVSVIVGGLMPIVGSLLAILWFSFGRRLRFFGDWAASISGLWTSLTKQKQKIQSRNLFVDLTTGLGDFDLVLNLTRYFFFTVLFLLVVSVIFTAFELWKFAGTIAGGIWLLAKYLFFLVPFLYLFFAPSAAMIATLATYVIKSRQNEIITWISAGQSVYRLLAPCFLLMALLGFVNWQIQERIAPGTNQIQDATRSQIRKGGITANSSGKFWVANDNRIYAFEIDAQPGSQPRSSLGRFTPLGNQTAASDNEIEWVTDGIGLDGKKPASDNEKGLRSDRYLKGNVEFERIVISPTSKVPGAGNSASDNGKAGCAILLSSDDRSGLPRAIEIPASDNGYGGAGSTRLLLFNRVPLMFLASASDNGKQPSLCTPVCVKNIVIYEFGGEQTKLQTVYHAETARWENGNVFLGGRVVKTDVREGRITKESPDNVELAEAQNPFTQLIGKPSHMTVAEIRSHIDTSESEVERRTFAVALEKRYTTMFLPLVIALFTAPFALSLSRKGKVVTIGYAVGLWLLFTGSSNLFEQFGLNGLLTPALAVWSPLVIFSLLGVYLMSKIRT